MIDNRLVEDIQLKLKPRAFLRAAARPHLRADPAPDRQEHGRQPGHAEADVRGRRGDEGARRAGLSRPADRLGRGDHRRARFRRRRSTTSPCSARWSASAARWSSARSTPREEVEPQGARSSRPRATLYRVAEEGGGEGTVKSFARGDPAGGRDGREGAQHRRRHLSGITTGLEAINAKTGGLHNSDLIILAGRPGMGKTSLATNIAFTAAQRFSRDHGGRDRARESRRAPGSPSSASKCRPTSSPPASSPSSRGISSENAAHGQDQPAGFPQPRPRRRRAADAAALHRRHARPDHRRAAHPRPAAEAAEGHRPGRGRLSPAAPGHRQELATTIASRRFPRSAAA